MGDYSDQQDLIRFMRSGEGASLLDTVRASLCGRTIEDVTFRADHDRIRLNLTFNDGYKLEVFERALELDAIRLSFDEVLRREYLEDYPERRRFE